MASTSEKNSESLGDLRLDLTEVEVGESYPVFGRMTKIVDSIPGFLIVEINDSVVAIISVDNTEKIDTLKAHAFEPGVFFGTVIMKSRGRVFLRCSKMVLQEVKDKGKV